MVATTSTFRSHWQAPLLAQVQLLAPMRSPKLARRGLASKIVFSLRLNFRPEQLAPLRSLGLGWVCPNSLSSMFSRNLQCSGSILTRVSRCPGRLTGNQYLFARRSIRFSAQSNDSWIAYPGETQQLCFAALNRDTR